MGLSDKEEPSVADLECRRRRGHISGSGRSLFYSKSTAPSKTFYFLAFNRIFHILLKKPRPKNFLRIWNQAAKKMSEPEISNETKKVWSWRDFSETHFFRSDTSSLFSGGMSCKQLRISKFCLLVTSQLLASCIMKKVGLGTGFSNS